MHSIEESIFDSVRDCLRLMISPSIATAYETDDIEDDDIEWMERIEAEGYELPWAHC